MKNLLENWRKTPMNLVVLQMQIWLNRMICIPLKFSHISMKKSIENEYYTRRKNVFSSEILELFLFEIDMYLMYSINIRDHLIEIVFPTIWSIHLLIKSSRSGSWNFHPTASTLLHWIHVILQYIRSMVVDGIYLLLEIEPIRIEK